MSEPARDPYFQGIQSALAEAGAVGPTLVVDRGRLDANIETLMNQLPAGMGYRIVAKSLPSPDLLAHVRRRTGTNRLMTFNQPMLQALGQLMPDTEQMLGKPLSEAAVRTHLAGLPEPRQQRADRIQWLADTAERLDRYERAAADFGVTLRINLELDVGLHRGGLVPGQQLEEVLEHIRESDWLGLAGFMGYEPHLASIPEFLGWRRRLLERARALYRSALRQAESVFGAGTADRLTRNAGGSPTYRMHPDTAIANEVSVGSALVKPTHFDLPDLAQHQPACFIATPVLKGPVPTRVPGLEWISGLGRLLRPKTASAIFIHGGNWLADPVDPPGLRYNRLLGRSSNQEMLNGDRRLAIQPEEFVFLRPHQSEAVFLQFGDIAVYEDGAIEDWWPVLPPSA
ncbi:alanine racemase [Halospina sp. K52047b]|uniref:alanine racemase n=1 Tax=Halospina sp. K52047b TaxID=2614160 RepID=UPI0017883A95|nr:alanine racemase [Halospina sp. K52047b]